MSTTLCKYTIHISATVCTIKNKILCCSVLHTHIITLKVLSLSLSLSFTLPYLKEPRCRLLRTIALHDESCKGPDQLCPLRHVPWRGDVRLEGDVRGGGRPTLVSLYCCCNLSYTNTPSSMYPTTNSYTQHVCVLRHHRSPTPPAFSLLTLYWRYVREPEARAPGMKESSTNGRM